MAAESANVASVCHQQILADFEGSPVQIRSGPPIDPVAGDSIGELGSNILKEEPNLTVR
jgi:hypothetical protein